jgi:hypothetical protein
MISAVMILEVWLRVSSHSRLAHLVASCVAGCRFLVHVPAQERMADLADSPKGECVPVVASYDGEIYHQPSVDLDCLAHAVGAVGTATKATCQESLVTRARPRARQGQARPS